jgi:hypothetical protein
MIRLIPFIESGYNLPRYWRDTGRFKTASSDPRKFTFGFNDCGREHLPDGGQNILAPDGKNIYLVNSIMIITLFVLNSSIILTQI